MIQKAKIALLMLLLMAASLPAAEYEQKIARSFTLAAGGSVELSSINGEIEVRTGGQVVDIRAVKKSDRKGEIESVEVVFEAEKDALKVYTKYPKRNTRAKVDFVVVIPENLAKVVFKSVNGRIDCGGKFSDLKLKTVNGRINFHGQFRAGSFETVNGPIEISQEPLLGGDLTAGTVNGSIDIELNRKSTFTVEAQTVNGSIDCDFGLNIERHLVGKSMRGKVNGGGYRLELETVNGSIELSKI